jgi:hypothetical protein
MFMVASSVVSTILILNYHHRNPDTHEMSEWVSTSTITVNHIQQIWHFFWHNCRFEWFSSTGCRVCSEWRGPARRDTIVLDHQFSGAAHRIQVKRANPKYLTWNCENDHQSHCWQMCWTLMTTSGVTIGVRRYRTIPHTIERFIGTFADKCRTRSRTGSQSKFSELYSCFPFLSLSSTFFFSGFFIFLWNAIFNNVKMLQTRWRWQYRTDWRSRNCTGRTG